MMHHPNMHHQAMSGHPPQHLGGHQGMPAHHQLPPHQMHRDNRHAPMQRMPMGPSQANSGMGTVTHGQQMNAMGAMGVPPSHHAPTARPSNNLRHISHHPSLPHHLGPPSGMKTMRRYPTGPVSGYPSAAGGGVVPYSQPHHMHMPTRPTPQTVTTAPIPSVSAQAPSPSATVLEPDAEMGEAEGEVAAEEARPAPPALANSKEKTPMCLVNELARYNKIKHQYRLTSETGQPHKKLFTVTLRLGEKEEYTAEGSSIKRAQHAAAAEALSQTSYPAPLPRQQPTNTHTQHRHSVYDSGAVMPTVELNALAMKLCQPAVYSMVSPAPPPRARMRTALPYRLPSPFIPQPYNQRMMLPGVVYRVRVCVGERGWMGEGATPQNARHDAAARALRDLRSAPDPPAELLDTQPGADNGADLLNSDVKSPVSLVHELALKKNLSVVFTVKSERGPPHMRVFITACTVGDMETEGEGNGKKVSKRRAAERMLDEMRLRWPPALLRSRPPPAVKRKPQPPKKKSRNLIKENGESGGSENAEAADNPISRLAMARHATRARSPQYRVLEERGVARRREFVVQCEAPPHCATGLGPNKKTAKRRAAQNVLLAMEMGATPADAVSSSPCSTGGSVGKPNGDIKQKEGVAGGAANDVRQPVPGVLLMDYHQRQPHSNNSTAPSESSAVGGDAASSPGAKDQLMYLSQLLGFTVEFSDFPKRNHGEYLSLVSLSTVPPVMCHGGGSSTAHSHEQCSRSALRALALMGLDAPAGQLQSVPVTGASTGSIGDANEE